MAFKDSKGDIEINSEKIRETKLLLTFSHFARCFYCIFLTRIRLKSYRPV